ncbi:MAG: FAD-linked oxidase C-terminal domain-containing protein [Gammaproteobacteria bacterium]|nr:MAG: FAD-linked oxidase C-terminal domain-containing protein [Gammaproteobacteria bacterium]
MSNLDQTLVNTFKGIVGNENTLTDASECWPYGYDNSRQHAPPDVVLFPTSHQQISDIVTACYQRGIPLVARGRGTGTTGAAVPVKGGVVLSLEHMDKIIDIDPDNRSMDVQPGVTNAEVQRAAARHGFFWPPDPTSGDVCTVGGNLACNAAGPRAIKYGTSRDNVLGLHAVTGTGDSIRTGVYTTKGVVGYDLTRLLIGAEGTLAVITRATLKLTPMAEIVRTLRAVYQDIHSAARAVAAIMSQPITPCALEIMDGKCIELANQYKDLGLPEHAGALLMIEVDGAADAIDGAVERVKTAAGNDGLLEIEAADSDAARKQLWQARKALSPALRHVAPKKINEDVVVPVSRIPELIDGLQSLAEEHGISIVNFGHAGNGNIHVNLLIDPDDPQQMAQTQPCLDKLFQLVLDLNGTLSGEHGIGMEKRQYVSREIDETTMKLMRNIKQQFDPAGILNPGKLFPD